MTVMATPGYAGELQQASQPQGGAVGAAPGQPSTAPPVTLPGPPQFLTDLQTGAAAPTTTPPAGQSTPPTPAAAPTLPKSVAAAPTTPTQYVTAEIQSSPAQSSSGQAAAQYIVVTVTEGALHSSDSVSDHSPPAAPVQTGVPTQVVQQVQRSVVQQVGSQTGKTGQTPQLTVTNLQPVHLTQEQLQQVPVQHVYTSQVQYVEEGDTSYSTSTIRSGSYPYSESPLYSQAVTTPYYEAPPASGSQVTTPVTSQTAPASAGTSTVSMFVTGPGQIVATAPSATGGGAPAVVAGGASGGSGTGGEGNVTGGSYVIQSGYVLGSGSSSSSNNSSSSSNQNYSHNARASPATVSILTEGEANSVPSADKKVQWLLENYETAEGVSLPRSTLYCHYLLHCQEQKLEPVNAASFGKLIRSVFMGLRTRRLGTRGNSKYHYYGLRIKASSSLQRLMEDQQHLAMRQQPFSQKQRIKPVQKVEGMTNGMGLGAGQQQPAGLSDISSQVQQYQQFLGALTQAIRNFAKSLESWLTNAMICIPEEMVRIKVTAASAFAQTLRRYTSLNHLAQAARAVLQNTTQINQMLSDLNRVDFTNVQEQASWVCRCEDRVVQRLEQDFKVTLQQQNSLEQWAAWLDGVVSQVLKPYQATAAFPKAAKLFLLKWSFYSSMVIRDLTLRSAASFGSFHLIRLLYDEYMYYLIEQRVAQAKGETPIAVMGEFASLGRSLNPLDPDKEEEEEEDEESEEEGQELSLAAADPVDLDVETMEPPAKLARTDLQGVLFSTTDN
ncbi:MHC class II regulatory factor RFX1a isoform X5 [Paramormyrops kingsleyae]|uniref:MHC class II regulatory factor RFX1a isoform X5 n=1 Tax=Paramormyrops kingsleyae TaxID=1676925 RepID=UPI003B971BF6